MNAKAPPIHHKLWTIHRIGLLAYGPRTKKKKDYFFVRLLDMSPPNPKSVPITIMLGSGTAAGADEARLTTRKPLKLHSKVVGRLLMRVDDNRSTLLLAQ
jgi:hypothetical protein